MNELELASQGLIIPHYNIIRVVFPKLGSSLIWRARSDGVTQNGSPERPVLEFE